MFKKIYNIIKLHTEKKSYRLYGHTVRFGLAQGPKGLGAGSVASIAPGATPAQWRGVNNRLSISHHLKVW